jgi:hypothetical protein
MKNQFCGIQKHSKNRNEDKQLLKRHLNVDDLEYEAAVPILLFGTNRDV